MHNSGTEFIKYMSTADYSIKLINNEKIDGIFINENSKINEFSFKSILNNYKNKCILKDNNSWKIIDLTENLFNIKDNILEAYFNLDTNTSLKKIYASENSNLSKIEVYNGENCQWIHLLGKKITKETLLNLSDSLIDRNNKAWGSIIIKDQNLRKLVEDKFIQKDWYFGSPKLYDKEELKKIPRYLVDFGAIDVWESAEYGEGIRVGVADNGLDKTAQELDFDRNIGYVNLSSQFTNGEGADSVPDPLFLNSCNHGTCVASVIHGKGVRFYGYAPKASWMFIKIGEVDGYSDDKQEYTLPLIGTENNLDFINMSYSTKKDENPAMISNIFAYNLAREYGEDYKGFFNVAANNDGNMENTHFDIGSWKWVNIVPGTCFKDGKWCYYNVNGRSHNRTFAATTLIPANMTSDKYIEFSGGSCACPSLTGMLILANVLYQKKFGKKPDKFELINWLKNRTEYPYDIENPENLITDSMKCGYGILSFMKYRDNSEVKSVYLDFDNFKKSDDIIE